MGGGGADQQQRPALLDGAAAAAGYRLQQRREEEDDDLLLQRSSDPDGGALLPAEPPPQEQEEDDVDNREEEQQQEVACWERFLQKKTIRVLLVENDESTRKVVSALLRCCMYEVIPVESGLQAWTYLQDMQNCVDVVLAEVYAWCIWTFPTEKDHEQ